MKSLNTLIKEYNESKDGDQFIASISVNELNHIINKSEVLLQFIAQTNLSEAAFNLLLDALYFFSTAWRFTYEIFRNLPPRLVLAFLIKEKQGASLLERIEGSDLEHILEKMPDCHHEMFYQKLDFRLPKIVHNCCELSRLPHCHRIPILKRLGYQHFVKDISNLRYLSFVATAIPAAERLSLIDDIGIKKIRGFIRSNDDLGELCKVISIEPTQQSLLLNQLICFVGEIEKTTVMPLQSKREKPQFIALDAERIACFYIKHPETNKRENYFAVVRVETNEIEFARTDLCLLCEPDNNTFYLMDDLPKEGKQNFPALHKYVWTGNEMQYQNIACMFGHRYGEKILCTIKLPNRNLLILSREENYVINHCKDWFLDLLDYKTFTIKRMLNIHKDQHVYVNQLTLLPDGATVLAWDDFCKVTKKRGGGVYTERAYRVCLIDLKTFSVQTITLDIDIEGKMKNVSLHNNQQTILTVKHRPSYNEQEKKYSSFIFHYQPVKALPNEKYSFKNAFTFFCSSTKPRNIKDNTKKISTLSLV